MDTLQSGDVIGFTFFTGYMAMFAASVFFFFERNRVEDKWKTSLLVSGLITMIAAVHYYYMSGVWIATGSSPTELRYIDWVLTVPLMCAEFYLLLRIAGARVTMLWRLIAASVLMLVAGYVGEALQPESTNLWLIVGLLGWGWIIFEIFGGEVKRTAKATDNPNIKKAFNLLRRFVTIGWIIYPLGYMTADSGLLSSLSLNIDLIYNIGDAINKIGFGLVIYTMAMADRKTSEAVPAI